ncbi:MAG: hypothetical protein EOM20_19250 [Spartobacteria bacterium]|nr:hypothetical protein [Spartobacteria bacterium]
MREKDHTERLIQDLQARIFHGALRVKETMPRRCPETLARQLLLRALEREGLCVRGICKSDDRTGDLLVNDCILLRFVNGQEAAFEELKKRLRRDLWVLDIPWGILVDLSKTLLLEGVALVDAENVDKQAGEAQDEKRHHVDRL